MHMKIVLEVPEDERSVPMPGRAMQGFLQDPDGNVIEVVVRTVCPPEPVSPFKRRGDWKRVPVTGSVPCP